MNPVSKGSKLCCCSIFRARKRTLKRKRKRDGEKPLEPLATMHGGVAQLGEHLPCTQGVRSSNLLISTNIIVGGTVVETESLKTWAHSSGG